MNLYLPTIRARCRPFIGLFILLFFLHDPLITVASPSVETVTCTPPGATATVSGPLSCAVTTVTLSAASPAADVIFSWSGPGGFASMLANPVVTLPGQYTLTVTRASDGSCTSTATVDVQQNISLPGATASVSGTINCTNSQVTLTGTTPASNMTFLWIGPNGFRATTQNVTVSEGGGYTLNVKNPVTGCTSTATVVVDKNTDLPGVAAYVTGGEILSCINTTVDLEASSPTAGVTYEWTGPGNFSSSSEYPEVSEPGVYTVKAINPANHCTATASVTVLQNITKPGATATVSGDITCAVVAVELTASSPTPDINYIWTSPAGVTSNAKTLTAITDGTYQLKIVKISNGCESTASVQVRKNTDPPGATAATSGPINCLVSQVSLLATTPTSPATFKWIGPNGYASTDQNPVTTVSGGYTLTVTNPANGCTTTKVAVVQKNITPPAGLTATVSAELSCSVTSVDMTATATTTGLNYSWTGPHPITNPTFAKASVSEPGVYTVTATNPVNGCSSTFSVTVKQNNQVPLDVVAQVSDVLTCTTTSVTLSGSSATAGVNYSWTGPNPITNPNDAQAKVSLPGVYKLTVTNPVNGCKVEKTVTVSQDILSPENVTAGVSDILTCTRTAVELTGASSTASVSYRWTGPGTIVHADQPVASVSAPGTYTLTVTNGANGCTVVKTVSVQQDIAVPANVTAVPSGMLTCTVPGVTLSASATAAAELTYAWTGPDQFTSALQRPVVTAPGVYTVIVKNKVNGCTSTVSATVLEDKAAPGVVASVLAPAALNCNTLSVTMTATSSANDVQYSWTGPAGYTSTEQNPSTTEGGDYTVVATNPINGCTSSSSVTIVQDKTAPAGVAASVSGAITCSELSVILEGQSSTANVTYRWTGPNGFTSTQQEPETDHEGVYELTVTNPSNGCKVLTSVTVEKNNATPQGVGATAPGVFTCNTTSMILEGTSTTAGVTYSWTGPGTITNPDSATPVITQAGSYELTVTNTQNNCSATAVVVVGEDKTAPAGVTATVSGPITCVTEDVTVTSGSTTSDVTYEWTGPNGFHSVEKSFPTNIPGIYTVTVKHPVSGCTVQESVTVTENKAQPSNVTATASGNITCAAANVTLTGASGTTGVTYRWTGPGQIADPTADVTGVSEAGDYVLTATHPASGCTESATVTVLENKTLPSDVTAVASGDITCNNGTVKLTADSGTPGATYSWTGPGTIQNPALAVVNVSVKGLYTVVVTHPVSGCSVSRTVNVAENKVLPGATAVASVDITCTSGPVPLTGGSGTADVNYLWTGPGAITNATSPTATTSTTGLYTLTVTDRVNGCVSTATEQVNLNQAAPNAGTITSSAGFILTCYTASTTLSCTSTTPNATFKWTNAAGTVLSTTNSLAASAADTYTFTVTHPVSGCTTSRSRTITVNRVIPTGSLNASGKISCSNPSVTLNATSSGSPVTYNWSGPGPVNVISAGTTTASASVTVPGTYTLTLTTVGGCTSPAVTITVVEELSLPADVTATLTGDMCADSFVTLTGSSSTPSARYRWTGPVESTEATLVTTVEGEYTLTVTNPASGCTVVRTVTVTACPPIPVPIPRMSSDNTETARKEAESVSIEREAELVLNVYPNPVRNIGVFEFTPKHDGPIRIELYSVTNGKVAAFEYPGATAGKVETVTFDTDKYASGLYIYRVFSANAEIRTGRIVIEH